MIRNADIFDQEELLAIANDGNDSTSSSHQSSSRSGNELQNDGVIRPRSPAMPTKADEFDQAPGAIHFDDFSPDGETNTSSRKERPNVASITAERCAENTCSGGSDDDSSSDDGFLESWFEEEKKTAHAQGTSGDVGHGYEGAITESRNDSEYADGGRVIIDGDEKKGMSVELELGASVLRWISSLKKSEGGVEMTLPLPERNGTIARSNLLGGVISLQHSSNGHKTPASRTSVLRLAVSTHSTPKRPRAGYEFAEATLEKIEETNGPFCRLEKYRGRVVHAPNAERAWLAPGSMVDCLARYDSQKRCYILEIVDLIVHELEPLLDPAQRGRMNGEAKALADDNTPAAQDALDRSTSELLDPCSMVKRADDQIRKLKRGKYRASTSKKIKTQKQENDILAEGKDIILVGDSAQNL